MKQPQNQQQRENTNNQGQQRECYYDFVAQGMGNMHYIPAENGKSARYAVREIMPKEGKPYYGVKLSALRGSKSDPQYSQIDVTVSADAKVLKTLEIINDRAVALLEETGNRQMVNVRFVIGDVNAKTLFKLGEKYATSVCGRLLDITHAWLGKEVIVKPADEESSNENEAA